MSFNFSNTNTSGIGSTSTPAKTGFENTFLLGGGGLGAGAPNSAPAFGTTTTSTNTFGGTLTTPSFGGIGGNPSFGNVNTFGGAAPPTFGAATSFGGGAPNTFGGSVQPTFGGGQPTNSFGAVQAAPGFGSGVGNTSFGGTAAPAFGTNTGFGAANVTATNSAAPAFGFGQATTTTPAGGLSGFGGFATASTAPAFGGFNIGNTATTTTAPSLFGNTFSGTAFGANSGFGTTQTTTQSQFTGFGNTFGSTFGKPTTAQSAFQGFGSTLGQQQQQQQAPPINPDEAFAQSIFNVSIYGDERDTTIANWNYLQAMWGTGKSFYSEQYNAVDITPQNYLCRFKTMGYSRLPGKENKMGLVALIFNNKTMAQLKDQQNELINNLNQIFGNKPNLLIKIDSIKNLSDTKCQVIFYIEEKLQQSNEVKRILASELNQYLNNQTNIKQQLNIEQILPLVIPDEDQLKEYLDNTPKGIDARMWRQAKSDNPDPTKFIPVPIIGFHELKWRIKCQENETDTHVQYLLKVEKDIAELKQRHANATAKIMEHRRKFADLSHRILKIIVKQEITRKMGVALSPEEEILRSKLENMQALVSAPTQFKGRLSELLSQMRMKRNQYAHTGSSNEYTLDKDSSEEMKTFLTMQQKAMSFLIQTVNKDLKTLKIISDGMTQLVRS